MGENAVMVTGSAGFIGEQLLRNLTAKKRAVVAVYHHKLPESLEQIYPVCVDFSSAELMAAPLRGVDTVIHLAWEGGLSGTAAPGASFRPGAAADYSANLRILANLVKAMERAGSRRLVFVSALGAASHAGSSFLREKYYAETLVLNSRIPERLVIRSGVVWSELGSGDRFLRTLVRLMRFPVYPGPGQKGGAAARHAAPPRPLPDRRRGG